MAVKANDIVGQQFNFLTVIERAANRHSFPYWKCKCICGKIIERRNDFLLSGKAMSCGCMHPRRRLGKHNLFWKGVGDLSGYYYHQLKVKAEERDIVFGVSIEYLWGLFIKQDGKCALTGVNLRFTSSKERRNGLLQTASLDRRDSNVGYLEGNVQWVHRDINLMKRDFPESRFVKLCKLVSKNAA